MDIHDAIFAIGSLVFFLALLPSIFSPDKPNALTSFVTSIVLFVFAFAYYDLGFEYAGTITGLTAILWAILFRQKVDV